VTAFVARNSFVLIERLFADNLYVLKSADYDLSIADERAEVPFPTNDQ
jgi:hypothetical protein